MEKDKIVVTECGIDNDGACNDNLFEKAKMIFIVSGRLIYRKGHDLLLDAILRIPNDLDFECRIVGDGPELKKISKRVQENNFLKKHLVLTGKIPYTEMVREYQKSNVFIMPSIRETTGTVLLEALANGLPVITINKFGGFVILDETCAWLYSGNSKEDYIQNLSDSIIYCINNPQKVKRRGENARQKAKEYTWENKGLFYQSIYEKKLQHLNE